VKNTIILLRSRTHKLAFIRTEDALTIIILTAKIKQPDQRKDEIRDQRVAAKAEREQKREWKKGIGAHRREMT
jgi:hypothetical protein